MAHGQSLLADNSNWLNELSCGLYSLIGRVARRAYLGTPQNPAVPASTSWRNMFLPSSLRSSSTAGGWARETITFVDDVERAI